MKYDVCVVGPRTLVGETLLEILEERAFPVGELFLLDSGEEIAETVSFAGDDYTVRHLAEFDFRRARIAFFCTDAAIAREYAPRAAQAGCLVIDDSEAFRMDPEVPLAVPEVNPEVLAVLPKKGIVASPNTCATMLALTLKPVRDALGMEAVNVVTLQSVSGTGRAGVDELARQSMALFNQSGIESEVYPKQIAFNLLARIGEEDAEGLSGEERKIIVETRRLLGLPELSMDVTAVRVPVFYGHALVAQVKTTRPVTREAARQLLEAMPGVVVYDDPAPGGYPTPVLEAATNDPVFVGRIRVALGKNAKGLSFWAVVDNMRKGAALNCVQIAEKLIQNRPDSPLM